MSLNLEQTAIGIELGSTNIKAVLIDEKHQPIASGSVGWENKFEDGLWTYDIDDAWSGLQQAYSKLKDEVYSKYGIKLTKVGALGFSGMMHGYLAFDQESTQLIPFRTWRNTNTDEAVKKLTEILQFNIPHRWTVSHIYQVILDEENHVSDIDFVTTLAGYIHWKLTGKKVVGVGEASGMFPIDSLTKTYNSKMVETFNRLEGVPFDVRDVLPTVLSAGEDAGTLTAEGAKLLDPTGDLEAGIPMAPPEGDAGTGMVATNAVAKRTGNVSAGTSIFSMIVLEEQLSTYYEEIDMVTTPSGAPVAMVHCNNFTTDINAWAKLFHEVASGLGAEVDEEKLFTFLFNQAMEADEDNGSLVSCNYYSGEPITGFEEGRPLFIQMPDSKLTIANFMRTQIYSALATLKIGMDILTHKEEVTVDNLLGHGGYFKTKDVGQQLMADAIDVPTSVMDTAGEGGPWGMAILATYRTRKEDGESLEKYLQDKVFGDAEVYTIQPTETGKQQFETFMDRYQKMLAVERTAVEKIN